MGSTKLAVLQQHTNAQRDGTGVGKGRRTNNGESRKQSKLRRQQRETQGKRWRSGRGEGKKDRARDTYGRKN
jgi:hypothetical protein